MAIGVGTHTYEFVEGWGKLPEGIGWGYVGGVLTDSKDRVYAFNGRNSEHPVQVLERDGSFLYEWDPDVSRDPHGVFINQRDEIFLMDRDGSYGLKCTTEGSALMTLGVKGQPAPKDGGQPFNRPTRIVAAPSGELFISDGYGNSRIHRFSSEGEHIASWGEEGTGQGQFNLPHSLWLDRHGLVWVCDRQNYRIQIFTQDGEFVRMWTDLARPGDLFIDDDDVVYVAEMDGRVSIFTYDGRLITSWGGEERTVEPGLFMAPHALWVDSRGDIYVGEVNEAQRIQKFARVG